MLPSERATAVVKQRGKEYGHPAPIYAMTAKLWSALLGIKISDLEVVQCMILLKQARQKHRDHEDNQTDTAGYANIYEMIQDYEEDE